MANHIKVAIASAIITLRQQGWSFRRIARQLKIHRETVARHVRLAEADSKPTNPTPGTEGAPDSKPANPTVGNMGPPSLCDPFQETVKRKLDQGLSAQRIWQDLVSEHGFPGSYSSVKRFVQRLGKTSPLPFRRMECLPGEEAQVDFGRGAAIETEGGRRRFPSVLRIVLSHSRKAYSEVVARQSTDEFIRVLENAFHAFGGVPRTLVIDNLRAAVTRADWYDPELNPKLQAFAEHYGTVILPTKSYTPRHKGKVESSIKYLKSNALKGRTFAGLSDQNRYLQEWESNVADHRIHGTTKRQVKQVFEEVERGALLPLPATRFPFFHEGQRKVHRDAHIEVDRAYYSVPPEYLGCHVWVRWDARTVRIFNQRFEQIAMHAKGEKGVFSTAPQHLHSKKISGVERGAEHLLRRIAPLGPQTNRWAQTMLAERGIQGVRVLQGLLAMTSQYRREELEIGCELALSHGIYRLRGLRNLIRSRARQEELDLTESHAIIRPMTDYGQIVRVSFGPTPPQNNDEFIAFEATSGEPKGKSPEPSRALSAVRPPVSALGSLSSGALSSGPASGSLAPGSSHVKAEEGMPS